MNRWYILVISLLLMLLTSCIQPETIPPNISTSPSDSSPIYIVTPPAPFDTPDPGAQELVLQAQAQLAQKLGIAVSDIFLISIEAVEWPDASLGCPQPGTFYAQIVTPGFQVILETKGEQYEYHMSSGGVAVLCENGAALEVFRIKRPTILSEEVVRTPVSDDVERLIDIAKKNLTQRFDVTLDEIEIVQIEKREWPDTSLGCAEAGLARRPVAIPGYRIILSAQGREYIFHTDRKSGVIYCPKG